LARSGFSTLSLIQLVTRNLTPVAGVIFLGWSAPSLLVLYFIDTMLAFGSVLLLVMAHITGMGEGKGMPSGPGDWLKMAMGVLLATAFFALPFGVPLYIMLAEFDFSLAATLDDTAFRYGLVAQLAFSLQSLFTAHRDLVRRQDDEAVLKRRTQFIVARWLAVIFVAMTGFVGVLGPRFGGVLMLVAYAVASVYAELFPERVDAWFSRPKGAKTQRKTGRGKRSLNVKR
jgi:hypothetical protein